MKQYGLIASMLVAGLLVACSGQQPRPESYFDANPKAALQQLVQCHKEKRRLYQAVRTKPPEALSAFAKECKYLMGAFDKEAARKALGLDVWDDDIALSRSEFKQRVRQGSLRIDDKPVKHEQSSNPFASF